MYGKYLKEKNRPRKNFFSYIENKKVEDATIEKFDHRIDDIKTNKEWKGIYMNLALKFYDHEEIGRQKGLEEGLKKGRREGIEKEKYNFARKLLSKYPDKELAELTELSLATIAKIRKEATS